MAQYAHPTTQDNTVKRATVTTAPIKQPNTMETKKQEYENLKLSNVRVMYAKVIRPGKAYEDNDPDEWSVNMYVTQEDSDLLIEKGVTPKEDKKGMLYFPAKRSTKTRNGDDQKPPAVVDSAKRPFTEDIGNNSVCNIVVTLIPWTKKGRSGIKLFLQAVQVVNHVPYAQAAEDYFDAIDSPGDGTDLL